MIKSFRTLQFERLEARSLLAAADFGDAPSPFPTTLGENGAQHAPTGPTLGANRDTEISGSHTELANGDDHVFDGNGILFGNEEGDDGNLEDGDSVDSSGHLQGSDAVGNVVDDEDGVLFGSLTIGGEGNVTINVQNAPSGAKLDAWIDFAGDGSWDDAEDQIAENLSVSNGDNVLTFNIPAQVAATTFARFRLSTAGNLDPTGTAADGEVEDHLVTLIKRDFGDARDQFPITLAANGARHVIPNLNVDSLDNDGDAQIDEGNEFGPFLGTSRDDEPDGVPSDLADTDDNNGAVDDEDGVTFGELRVGQIGASVQVHVEGFDPNAAGPKLDAWIDFNGDGDWNDPQEQIADSVTLDITGFETDHTITFNIPNDAGEIETFARFRLSSAGNLDPTGEAADGEVEDYLVAIGAPVALGTEGNDKIRIRPTNGPRGPVDVNLVVKGREVLVLTFAPFKDIVVRALGGNDKIEVVGELDTEVFVSGGPGNDTIIGGNGRDTLEGDEGNDTLKGGAGRDDLVGGAGNDKLDGGDDDDTLEGDAGKDNLKGGPGFDTLVGGSEDDKLDGGEGGDTLLGNVGRDNLKGGPGEDDLFGGSEDDKLDGGLGNDFLRGGEGKDSLQGNDGNDILLGEGGDDTLSAGRGFDLLIGGIGLDKLTGSSKGNSILIGGETSNDESNLALRAILAEWSRLENDLPALIDDRIAHLTTPNSGGLNGNFVLIPGDTVADDGAIDTLKFSFGFNWIFPGAGDKLARAKATDRVAS